MNTPKRYGVFCNRTHAEVHGHGAETKEQMEEWVRNVGPAFYHIGIVQIRPEDTDIVPCPA